MKVDVILAGVMGLMLLICCALPAAASDILSRAQLTTKQPKHILPDQTRIRRSGKPEKGDYKCQPIY